MVKTFFDQPINNDVKTYENIRTIATGQGDDYTTGCLLDYPSKKIDDCKDDSKMIAINLSNQQARDADPRAIQQINFTSNLDRAGDTPCFLLLKMLKSKRNCLRLFARKFKSFVNVLQNNLSIINTK